MLHCIRIKEKFCALHDERSAAGQADYGDLAHGLGAEGVYRAVAYCSGFPLGLIQG
jgi:hypothetical protein